MQKTKRGFTLIEVLLVLAIIAILASLVIIAINPARQFAQTRNTQRWAAVNSILNSIHQNMADNNGSFEFDDCGASSFPSTSTAIVPERLFERKREPRMNSRPDTENPLRTCRLF